MTILRFGFGHPAAKQRRADARRNAGSHLCSVFALRACGQSPTPEDLTLRMIAFSISALILPTLRNQMVSLSLVYWPCSRLTFWRLPSKRCANS
jgi:hypothetical protein